MKKTLALILSVLFLTGCNGTLPIPAPAAVSSTPGMSAVTTESALPITTGTKGFTSEAPEVSEAPIVTTTPATTIPTGTTAPEETVTTSVVTDPATTTFSSETQIPAEELSGSLTLSFVGDCMLASYMGEIKNGNFADTALKQDPSYFLEKVREIFESDDFTVANLECVLTDSTEEPTVKDDETPFWFKGPTQNVEILLAGSVEAVSLANNHVGDYGESGKADTIAALDGVGIQWGDNENVLYLEKNGIRVAVICHGLWIPGQASTISRIVQKVSSQSDYQIVFFHGGEENVHEPEEWKVDACHQIADAGADLIIGNHPHVLQPMEEYNGVTILYSIGNFCYGGHWKPENRTMILRVTLEKDESGVCAAVLPIPCYVYTGSLNNWQPAIIQDERDKQAVLDFLSGKIATPFPEE
ncbi:MAG: CapA family protein [Eubacteriales bacterium]